MELQKGWLKCQVSDGILPEEYAVQCSNADDYIFSFFAPRESIDVDKNLVKVYIMERQIDYCLIYIPFDPLEGLSKTIKVHTRDVHRTEW